MAMGVSYCLWPFVVLIKILKNASAGINMESGTELMRSKILKPCLEIQVLGSKTIQERKNCAMILPLGRSTRLPNSLRVYFDSTIILKDYSGLLYYCLLYIKRYVAYPASFVFP